ncbi:MAG: MFS transporter [Sphingobacteriales bacterium]|nr:MFS transporter [Sphingobacteriales bacterium]
MQNFRIKLSLYINYFVFAILLNSVGTVILLVQGYFLVSKQGAAYLDPYKDLSIAVASFIVGAVVTKVGYRKSMIIALSAVTIACFIIPSIKIFFAVKLLYAVFGFSFGLTKVSVYGTIGLVTNSEKAHLSFMNFIESFFMVGVVGGYYLFAVFSKNPETGNWFKVYYLLGGLSFFALLMLLTAKLDESEIKKEPNNSFADDFLKMVKLAALPLVISFVVCAFFYVLIEQSSMNWIPTFNKDVLKISEPIAIILGSILSASIALGRFLAGIVLRKLKWFVVLISCIAGAAITLLISLKLAENTSISSVTNFADVPLVAFVMPTLGIFLAPIYPAINSVILASLPKERHGAMSGLIVVFSAIGGTLGSVITGSLFDSIGGIKAFYFSLIPMAILLFFLFLFYRQNIGFKSMGGH